MSRENKIRVPLEMNSKKFWLSPYTSKQEKDILIMSSFEVLEVDKYLELIGFYDYHDLSLDEKRIILWKIREISLGNEVNIKYKCDNTNCLQTVETTLSASDFLVNGSRNDSNIKKLDIEVNDSTLHKFVEYSQDELDDLDLKKYEVLLNTVKENQQSFNFIKEATCLSCGEKKPFDMSSIEYILDSLSDENLGSIYRVYSHLTYFGKYSKDDIDGMYPFERTIFIGLLHSIKNEK